jgi:hypothetical protein
MIDIIYANGCSWTAGDEIEKDPKFIEYLNQLELKYDPEFWTIYDKHGTHKYNPPDLWLKFHWPSQVAKQLNVNNVINNSVGGGSNYRLLRLTCDFILSYPPEKRENLLVIIGWTALDRKEIYLRDKNSWERFNYTQPFSKTLEMPDRFARDRLNVYDNYQKDYISYIFSEFENAKIYFQQLFLLSNLLENLKIKYLFFNAFQFPDYAHPNLDENFIPDELKNDVKWYKTNNSIINDETMQTYVYNKKLPVAEHMHPMIDAHASWAEHLVKIMQDRKIV